MPETAFIFDLDGVITDTAVYHFQAWQRLAHGLGIAFDEHDNEQLKGVSRLESLEAILARSEQSFDDEEKHRLMHEKNEDYKALIATISPEDVLPGALPALEYLKKQGILAGLASASKNATAIIEQLQIGHLFDYIADANIITNSKPAPDIFLDAARGLGVPAGQCIGVEDAAAGVQAIKSANMFAVGIGDAKTLNQADMIYADMRTFNVKEVLAAARSMAA